MHFRGRYSARPRRDAGPRVIGKFVGNSDRNFGRIFDGHFIGNTAA